MARFDDLCADFQKRKPHGPITAEVPWFNVPLELQKGSESVNDVLRKYLKDFNLEYLNEMGTVWFLYHDLWKCCTHEIKDGKIHFYMACFDCASISSADFCAFSSNSDGINGIGRSVSHSGGNSMHRHLPPPAGASQRRTARCCGNI
mgnify:CR=1 FL=1